MNFIARLFQPVTRLFEAARKLPEIERKYNEARIALNAVAESYALVRQDYDQMQFESDPLNRQMLRERAAISEDVEAWMLLGTGPQMAQPTRETITALAPAGDTRLTERMWELELALEDRGWQRQLALAQTEFSRYGLQQIILISRLYFIKNPVIRRGVLIAADYCFGRGIEITTDDDDSNEVINDFIEENKAELGHLGLTEKDHSLHTDGNLFFVFFVNKGTGKLQLRTIDATEMDHVVTDPNDSSQPQYYKRKWNARVFDASTGNERLEATEAWYPALDYQPAEKPDTLAGKPVMWDSPVLHMKTGSIAKWLFGCPEIYSAIDWARAYRQYLEDWATLNRSLARFAWDVKTQGGQQAVQNLQKVFGSTLGLGGTSVETNPPPVAGSTFITTRDSKGNAGTTMDPIRTANVTDNPERGRRIGLMVCSALGLPETMLFGDTSTGSLATATSLDRPTELKFLQRQELWRHFLQRIITYVLQASNTAPKGKLREARAKAGKNGDLSDITITVKFPAVLEHDIAVMVSAIIQAATLGGFQMGGTMDMRTCAKLLLAELGVEDPTAVIDAMYPPEPEGDTDGYDPKNYADNGKADAIEDAPAPPPQPGAHLVTPSFGKEARLLYAIEKLTEASQRIAARYR